MPVERLLTIDACEGLCELWVWTAAHALHFRIELVMLMHRENFYFFNETNRSPTCFN